MMRSHTTGANIFDVIVVGAGTAGSVVAARTAAAGLSVCLLEAGDQRATDRAGVMDIGPPSTVVNRIPAVLDGQHLTLPRGRTLGGSGAVNGGYCLPPRPSDLHRWPGHWDRALWWGLARAVHRLRPQLVLPDLLAQQVAAAFPGSSVRIGQARAGARRITAYHAWDPARAGAQVRTGATVRELLWRAGRVGGQCTGVRCADGTEFAATTVVVSSGTVGSADILWASGLGPATGHPIGTRLDEHPELLLPAPVGNDAMPPAGDTSAQCPTALRPLLSQINRLSVASTTTRGEAIEVELRPYSMPLSAAIPGLAPQPHHIGLSLMTPTGHPQLLPTHPHTPGKVTVDFDTHRSPDDTAVLRHATDIVSEALPIDGPAVTSTSQHLSGSARMGEVVDDQGRVLGVTGLRIIDASVLPQLPRCGPYLTILALAEVMSEQLLADLPSPCSQPG